MKIFLLIIIFLIIENDAFAERKISVDRNRSGGANQCEECSGWDRVTETHEDTGLFGWGSGKSTLKCAGRNTDPCAFQNTPSDLVQSDSQLGVNFLNNYVDNQINLGNYTGSYSDQINVSGQGLYNRVLNWTGTASDEILIDIIVTKVIN